MSEPRLTVIQQVRQHARRTDCKCRLRAGMTREQLLALGSGCTPNYVCSTLTFYRSKLPERTPEELEAADIALWKELSPLWEAT